MRGEEEGMGKNEELLSLYRGDQSVRLSTSLLRIAYFPSATIDGTGGVGVKTGGSRVGGP